MLQPDDEQTDEESMAARAQGSGNDQSLHQQLEIIGLEEARYQTQFSPSKASESRKLNLIDTVHKLRSELPGPDDMAFLHAGLCQTGLPHSRPASNSAVWRRQSGRFTLHVRPGVAEKTGPDGEDYIGVPYGPKARLIMIFLQTEGVKSRTVYLGKNLSAFLRSLKVPNTGGPRGAIRQVKEQFARIAGCAFTLTFDGGDQKEVANAHIVDDARLWRMSSNDWSAEVELSERFHRYLCQHPVPLDKRAIGLLQSNSLGLDLYTLFAYRLPRIKHHNETVMLNWPNLQGQIGSEYVHMRNLARHVKDILPLVLEAYPDANVELKPSGLLLKKSPPSVPYKTQVNGFTLIQGTTGSDANG